VYEAPARALGLRLQFIGAGKPEEVESAFEAAAQQRAEAIFVLQGPGIGFNQTRIAELAVQHRLPSMWGQSDAIARGGLLGYGANRIDLHRRAAGYVDKILKGARPADLPIELPSQFDFPINLKTAQALGLTIPQSVLSQATELIQ
jgi:putative ABC transport system substrate-binding protein